MKMADLSAYARRIIPSLGLMGLITTGMYLENPWLQYGSIFLVLGGQMIYQSMKTVRSKPIMDANLEEARRTMKRKLILDVDKSDVSKARNQGKAISAFSPRMSILLIVPLVLFLVTGQVLSFVFPGIPSWQSYAIGFLITMPVSTILSFRMGMGSPTQTGNPNSYAISDKGIVFEHMGQYYILRYPLVTVTEIEESNCLEIQGQDSQAIVIPSKIRLYNLDLKKVQRAITKFIAK
jgi:uncharacterized membrane protein